MFYHFFHSPGLLTSHLAIFFTFGTRKCLPICKTLFSPQQFPSGVLLPLMASFLLTGTEQSISLFKCCCFLTVPFKQSTADEDVGVCGWIRHRTSEYRLSECSKLSFSSCLLPTVQSRFSQLVPYTLFTRSDSPKPEKSGA